MASEPVDLEQASLPTSAGRVSFERLRERTDELELLISGLSMVALFGLPGWLIDQYEGMQPLLPLWLLSAAAMAMPMTVLICYLLATCFALHLAMRAYWVGLIGLKSAYPGGIRWSRAMGTGPLTREWLQRSLPGIDTSIERADRAASMLFSVITLSGLILLWLGVLSTAVFIGSAIVGSASGTNAAINTAMAWFANVIVYSVLLLWLLDAVLARFLPVLRGWAWYRGLVWLLAQVVGVYFPPRLIAPIRLTLQTNSRPLLFLIVFVSMIVVLPMLALRQFQASFGFDRFGTYGFLHARDIDDGHKSGHYESQRIGRNRARGVPMIPAPVIETAWLPLLLPYLPIRDDPLVAVRCPERTRDEGAALGPQPIDDAGAAKRSRAAAECLGRLWEVRLNGLPVALDGFIPTERADVGFRGLSGYVDLRGLAPGPQRLEVVFRPHPEQEAKVVDEAISARIRYAIPFLWSPEAAAAPP
jgi:hypothetical protein